jgi:release factor glutamine methyltransferase
MENRVAIEFANKLNKTFARRIGKRLSDYNKELLTQILPKYEFSNKMFTSSSKQKKFLEIGFGMGEHLFHQATLNPESLYVGAEVYLNGVANFLKLITQENHNNFLIWPNDLDMMVQDIPDNSLDGIYILFPDPWHKRKYLKKRLVNKDRLNIFKLKLKHGGFIDFASDIEDYFEDVKKLFAQDNQLIINSNFLIPHEDYIATKYHQKAIKENRLVQFLQAKLVL